MKISIKLNILQQMNRMYDDVIAGYDLVCDRLCAHCCTRNVTMTTLEGYRIMKYLETPEKDELLKRVKADAEMARYVPAITTNQMAQMGYEGKEIQEEDPGENTGACPVLENNECPIYEARPFSCRCMVSKHMCEDKGYAEIDPFIVTVNNVFYQFIEHIDTHGLFGNFSDVLMFLESKSELLNSNVNGTPHVESGLLKNNPLRALLVPPEHREQIQPVLESIQRIKIPKEG